MIESCAFVAISTRDLARARRFWAEALGLAVTEERPGEHFVVDAGGLRLCVDVEDGDVHRVGGTDPVVGLRVARVAEAVAALRARGVAVERGPTRGERGSWALVRDPDGHGVVLTEFD